MFVIVLIVCQVVHYLMLLNSELNGRDRSPRLPLLALMTSAHTERGEQALVDGDTHRFIVRIADFTMKSTAQHYEFRCA